MAQVTNVQLLNKVRSLAATIATLELEKEALVEENNTFRKALEEARPLLEAAMVGDVDPPEVKRKK